VPDEGEIAVDGIDSSEPTLHRQYLDSLGTVLQEELFDGADTLAWNAAHYGAYYSRYDAAELEAYLDRFNLDKNRMYSQLSKGEQLKFQFAFALAHHPKLLLLDEPTGIFDPDFRKEFFSVIEEFLSEGTGSVVLATHLTDDLDRMADYIVYLNDGQMELSGDIEELRDSYRLISGEAYKLKLLPKEEVIYMEEGTYGASALVRQRYHRTYDKALAVTSPTVEQLMYYFTKGRAKR
jgi:ABC-2 type transport system ATP-binding protein